MGYLFYKNTKEEVIEDVLNSTPQVDYSKKGNSLWVLCRNTEGKKFICLFLLRKQDNKWGYKSIDEAMHPYYYDCPKKLLDASECDREDAIKWREKCRELAEKKKRNKAFAENLRPGDIFMYHNQKTTYEGPYHKRGYIVGISTDGRRYKYKMSQAEPY